MMLQTASMLAAAEELALARSAPEFADSVEHLARELSGAAEARLFLEQRDAGREGGHFARPGAGGRHVLDEASLPGRCLLFNEPIRGDSAEVPGWLGGRAALCLPVRRYGAAMGVLALAGGGSEGTVEDLARLTGLLSELVALRESQETLAARAEELLVRAGGEEGHVLRVCRLAGELAAWMDLSARSRRLVDRAARLHDVGKLTLRDRSESEREALHPEAGAEWLRSTRVLEDLAPLVATHHEAHDGSGFPRGLRGDEVPIEAWVLALAEDLEESRASPSGRDPWLESWMERRSRAHHPAALDALGGLVVAGRLQELLR